MQVTAVSGSIEQVGSVIKENTIIPKHNVHVHSFHVQGYNNQLSHILRYTSEASRKLWIIPITEYLISSVCDIVATLQCYLHRIILEGKIFLVTVEVSKVY